MVVEAAEEKICGLCINTQITFYAAKGVHLLDVLQQNLMRLVNLFPLKGLWTFAFLCLIKVVFRY